MGERELGPWVGEPEPHGKTPFGGSSSHDMTYLRTSHDKVLSIPRTFWGFGPILIRWDRFLTAEVSAVVCIAQNIQVIEESEMRTTINNSKSNQRSELAGIVWIDYPSSTSRKHQS